MNFHTEIEKAFKPLSDYLSDHNEEEKGGIMSQYMYMFHDDEDTYHYKHFATRDYFKIKTNGSTEGKIENWRDWK